MEATSNLQTRDRNGALVAVGTIVRVLEVPRALLAELPAEEAAAVLSMKGAAFSVYEIDQSGCAWIEKWWDVGKEHPYSHSLALAPSEMEVVASAFSDA